MMVVVLFEVVLPFLLVVGDGVVVAFPAEADAVVNSCCCWTS